MTAVQLTEEEFEQLGLGPVPPPAKKRGKKRPRPSQEPLFALQCKASGLPQPRAQHLFAAIIGRRWRFDFAWPAYMVALEIDGLMFKGMGRHQTVTGQREDMRKGNAALQLGWAVVHAEQSMVKSGEALKVVGAMLVLRGWRSDPESHPWEN